MKRLAITFLAFVLLAFAAPGRAALAQESSPVESILQEEAITLEDLGVPEPGLLPSSPFYFLKTWARGIQRFLAFNPIAKAELELRFANEKLAEAKKLADEHPDRTQVLERAIENYSTSQERLRQHLETLAETSANPNVDRLLTALAERAVKHEKLFAELAERFVAQAELQQEITSAAETISSSVAAAARREAAERFAERLERALEAAPGSELRHLRAAEMLERIQAKADEPLRERLSALREEFAERFADHIEDFARRHGEQAQEVIAEVLEKLPGERARRLVILEELRERGPKRLRDALEAGAEVIEERIEAAAELRERAEEAIGHARERLEKLEAEIAPISAVPNAVTALAREARLKLDTAIRAFEAEGYGQAFGQALSAEVTARNALRILEQERPQAGELEDDIADLGEDLDELAAKIVDLGPEAKARAEEALRNSRRHLELARENLARGALDEAHSQLAEAKYFERLAERTIEAHERGMELPPRREAPPAAERPVERRPELCTQVFDPVCGIDGKTYSNACFARVVGVAVSHSGVCRPAERKRETPPPSPPPAQAPVPQPPPTPAPASVPESVSFRIEADDLGFYPLSTPRVPKGARVAITFVVRETNVYFGGLDFRSAKFQTAKVPPGGSTTVEFTADDDLVITSYWPASSTRKAELKVEVE